MTAVCLCCAHVYSSRLAGCAEALKSTRLQNNVKLPLCVDPVARARLQEHLQGLSPDDAACHVTAINSERRELQKQDKAEMAQKTNDWRKRRIREMDRSGTLAGMDPGCEVPPADKRPWCTHCLDLRVLRTKDIALATRLEEQDEKATTAAQRLYSQATPSQHSRPERGIEFLYDHRHAYQQEFADAGMDTFSMDAFKSYRWDLLTHGGFHTWPHHDGSGMGTWVYIRHGCKIWCPLVPRLPRDRELTQLDLFECMHHILRPPPSSAYEKHADALYMFLLPHDVL